MRPFLIISSFATLALLSACSRDAARPPEATLPAVAVRTARVELTTTALTQEITGTVRPRDYATLSAKLSGTIATLPVALGQTVSPGQLLATLHAPEHTERVAQARAALTQIERELARDRALLATGAASAESVRTLEDRASVARSALAEAESFLNYTRLTAPFAGVITRRHLNPGDLASPGQPVVDLEATTTLRIEAAIPESLPALPLGTALPLSSSETATLAELSPAADPLSRTRFAKLDLAPNSTLRSGQFVRLAWPAATSAQLTLPSVALSPLGQMLRVFVVTENRAQLRLVRTGATLGDRTVILSGLNSGETVIVAPPASLRDGQPVQLLP